MKPHTYTPERGALRQRIYNRMVENRDSISRIAKLLKTSPDQIEKKLDKLIRHTAELRERAEPVTTIRHRRC